MAMTTSRSIRGKAWCFVFIFVSTVSWFLISNRASLTGRVRLTN